MPPALTSSLLLEADRRNQDGGAETRRRIPTAWWSAADVLDRSQCASRAEGQRHHHHEASLRLGKDRSADGVVQRHRADVNEPVGNATEHLCDLSRYP